MDAAEIVNEMTRYDKIKCLALFIWSMDDKKKGNWTAYPYITIAGAIMEELDPTMTVITNAKPNKKMVKRLNKLAKKNI